MKALLSHTPGGPETLSLDDIAELTPGPGQVLVAVKACGINFLDTLVIRDLYQTKPARPFAPGVEVAGTVAALGEGVARWSTGDRVIALPDFGGFAEAAVCGQDRVFALPDAVSFARGAGLSIAYGTAIHALKDRANLRSGDETMVVLGASGGAGLAAVELGLALGLKVIGAVSSPEKAQVVRKAGASDVVIYPRTLDRDASRALAQAFKAAAGGEGADIIYDCIGGDFAEPAIRSLAWGGRYLTIGFAAGIPSIPLNLTLLKSIDIRGVFYGAFTLRDPARNQELMAELIELAAAGKVASEEPTLFPLARGGEAIALLADRKSVGKVVVTP